MMTSEDFRKWMNDRKYNQSQTADILRVSQSQISRWVTGKTEIPGPVEVVLDLERGMRAFLIDFPAGAESGKVRDARSRCQAVYESILIDPAIPLKY